MPANRRRSPLHPTAVPYPFALPIDGEWVRYYIEVPSEMACSLCNLTARQLRAHAEVMDGLADGRDPNDLFSRHAEVIQSSWQEFSAEADRLLFVRLMPFVNGIRNK